MNDFVGFIFIAAILWGGLILVSKKTPSSMVQAYSSTMGVLGTFVGIYIGLMNFDEQNIAASVPELLGGLKTAFSTSIAGMIVSLLAKLFYHPKKEVVINEDTVRANAILGSLNEIVSGINKHENNLDVINMNILSVTAAIEKGANTIDSSLKRFGEEVANQSSKELIASIQKVMDDFNAKINSQLGDEFRCLSESTKNLNEWQKMNLSQMEKVGNYSIVQIKKMEEFSKVMDTFEDIREYLGTLHNYLEVVNNSGEDMKKVVPSIKKEIDVIHGHIEKMTSEIEQATGDICKSLYNCSAQIKNSEGAIMRSVGNFESSVSSTMGEFSRYLAGILRKLYEDINRK